MTDKDVALAKIAMRAFLGAALGVTPRKSRAYFPGARVHAFTLVEYIAGQNVPTRVHPHWRVRCCCGDELIVRTDNLVSGRTRSCGKKPCVTAGKNRGAVR